VRQKTLRKSGRPTLSDIAARADVSISTASRVLSNQAERHKLTEEVVARVRKVAAELDYSPNLLVKSLQQGRTNTITLFNAFRTRSDDDLYMDRLSTAIEQASGRLGYDVLMYCVFERSIEETYRNLNGGRCDGLLLFAPPDDEPLLPYLRSSRLPTVLINSVDSAGQLSSVRDDYVSGLSQVADRLLAFGHRRIATLTNEPRFNRDADIRVSLLRRFLQERGAPVPDQWAICMDDDRYGGTEGALSYLMSQTPPPTALFCWHDRQGYHMLEHCQRLGIRVPEQLSVIGYDGLHWPSQTPHVLASVRIDIARLAEEAVTILDSLITGTANSPIEKLLPVAIMTGTTLARPSGD
jgi:DNA-binding LacI/PurR family transcriptional regulator